MKRCLKCGGLMHEEKFYAKDDTFWGWRCLSCGDIIDKQILENRRWYNETCRV